MQRPLPRGTLPHLPTHRRLAANPRAPQRARPAAVAHHTKAICTPLDVRGARRRRPPPRLSTPAPARPRRWATSSSRTTSSARAATATSSAISASTPSERAACKVVDTRKDEARGGDARGAADGAARARVHHRLLEHVEIESRVFIFMELAPNGELFGRVVKNGSLTEPEARRYFGQPMAAVEHIHKAGVAHRDLKLENALLSADDRCKVCDFGLAHVAERAADGAVVPAVLTDVRLEVVRVRRGARRRRVQRLRRRRVERRHLVLLDARRLLPRRGDVLRPAVHEGDAAGARGSRSPMPFGLYQRPCMLSPRCVPTPRPRAPPRTVPPSALPRRSPHGPRLGAGRPLDRRDARLRPRAGVLDDVLRSLLAGRAEKAPAAPRPRRRRRRVRGGAALPLGVPARRRLRHRALVRPERWPATSPSAPSTARWATSSPPTPASRSARRRCSRSSPPWRVRPRRRRRLRHTADEVRVDARRRRRGAFRDQRTHQTATRD